MKVKGRERCVWVSKRVRLFLVNSIFKYPYYYYSAVFPAISLGFFIFGEIFVYVTVFQSNHRGSQILSSWMVHDGRVCVAGSHPSRT